MEIVLFVPGILGSKLATPEGQEVWPPTPFEALRGYRRTEELKRPDLMPTGIVERVCIDVYGSLLDALEVLGYTENGAQHRLIRYAYDWRRDLVELADELGHLLDQLVAEHGADVEIKLVCHSMGGLVTRALLEGTDHLVRPWGKAVKLAIFLATPHEGAPLAFARAIGVGGSSTGLNAGQLRELAEAPNLPAAYQLFPHATLMPIWKLDDPIPFKGVSLFDPAVAAKYGLVRSHLDATRALHALLDPERRPPSCRYFSIVSAAHETVIHLNEDQDVAVCVSVRSAGDGTVPIESAAALKVQTAFVQANHVGVAQKSLTHRMIGMLLGATPVEPLPMAFDVNLMDGAPSMNLSLSDRTIAEGEPYEIVVGTTPQDMLEVRIRMTRQDASNPSVIGEIPIVLRTSAVESISLSGPLLSVGQYLFELVSDDGFTFDSEELLVTGQEDG